MKQKSASKTSSKKSEKLRGKEGFVSFYETLFGERWEKMNEALLKPAVHASLNCADCEPYFLDPASVCAALCLPLDNAQSVLDMCAAPGGKTLVLSLCMNEDCELWSNERSAPRKKRLDSVVSASLPESISSRVHTSCSDGALWCRKETERFHSILLDAPCSSERHVLTDPKYLDEWSESRIKTVSMEQWALLSSSWRLLKQGGYLLYSTCALTPQENYGQIQRLTKKFSDVQIVSRAEMEKFYSVNAKKIVSRLKMPEGFTTENIFSFAEDLTYGLQVFPDSSNGAGPLYFCLLKKSVQ